MKYSDLSEEQKAQYDKMKSQKQVKGVIDQEKADSEFSLIDLMKNIPGDTVQAGEEMYHAVRHPIETAKAIGGLALGGAQKLIPGKQGSEKYADAFVDDIVKKYGSWDKFLVELEANPVHTAMDIVPVLKGFGVAAKASGMGKLGAGLSTAGTMIDPVNMAMTGPRAAGKVATQFVDPADIYASAAKFSTVMDKKQGIGTRREIAQTAIDEGIMPTWKGVDKLEGRVVELNNMIDDMIAVADSQGSISASVVGKHLNKVREKYDALVLDGATDLAKVNKVADEFGKLLASKGVTRMTASELQKFKKAAYKKIDWDVGMQKADKAVNDTRKAMAKGAKEGLEDVIPPIKDLNALEGQMLKLKDPLMTSAGRIGNRDFAGIGVPLKVQAGIQAGTATGIPGAGVVGGIAGGIAGAMDVPTWKARGAIKLSKIKKQKLADILATPNTGFLFGRQFTQQAGEEALQQQGIGQ